MEILFLFGIFVTFSQGKKCNYFYSCLKRSSLLNSPPLSSANRLLFIEDSRKNISYNTYGADEIKFGLLFFLNILKILILKLGFICLI